MNYTESQLLALLHSGSNAICLVVRLRRGKHPQQIRSNASNLITASITPSNGTAVQNVSMV